MEKITKVSAFSGLNQLRDLTMKRKEYASLLGYTPKEIAAFFPKRLDALAKKHKTDRKGALKLLLDWYDSYRLRRRDYRNEEVRLGVRVQVQQVGERGGAADSRKGLRRRLQKRQAPRHARRHQLPHDEAEH